MNLSQHSNEKVGEREGGVLVAERGRASECCRLHSSSSSSNNSVASPQRTAGKHIHLSEEDVGERSCWQPLATVCGQTIVLL